jgi:hypothetical protein
MREPYPKIQKRSSFLSNTSLSEESCIVSIGVNVASVDIVFCLLTNFLLCGVGGEQKDDPAIVQSVTATEKEATKNCKNRTDTLRFMHG